MKELEAIQFVHQQMLTAPKFPEFKTGDTVVVTYKIVEGDKTREQDYRGDVIQIKGHGTNKTFTVRKISNAIGVERIFPMSSPAIDSIEVTKRGKVRRAKLYYLRDVVGIVFALDSTETARMTERLSMLGYAIRRNADTVYAVGAGLTVSTVPATLARHGTVALRFSLQRPKSGERVYRLGASELRFEDGGEAIWIVR